MLGFESRLEGAYPTNNPTSPMNEISLKFARYSPPRLRDFARTVTSALSKSPGIDYFPSTKPTVAEVVGLTGQLDSALGQETSTSVAALRAQLTVELVELLKLLAGDLETRAVGDLVKLANTGFEIKQQGGGTRSSGPTATPQNARAKHGLSRQVIVSVDPVGKPAMYQGAFSYTADGEYTPLDPVTNSRKIIFNDLERGKDVYLKVRALSAAPPSDWSDLVKIMVI
jgi:hypothetical protein